MGSVAGASLFVMKRFVSEKLGKDAWGKIADMAPEVQRPTLKGMILAKGWYDRESAFAIYSGIRALSDREMVVKSGEFSALSHFTGLFGIVAKLVPFEMVLNRAGDLWRKVYDEGTMRLHAKGSKEATLRLEDFPADEGLIAHLEGFFKAAAEHLGKTTVRVKGRPLGATSCEIHVQYD